MIFSKKPFGVFPFLFILVCLLLSTYFTLASVQGDFGIIKRVEVQKESELLKIEYLLLIDEIRKLENRTRRLSDDFLDFDLLDTQAREILGVIRPQEIIIN
jgi:cell division protein FtsB